MCSVNHNLKAIFIHVHKTGGTYISYMLHKYYGFKNYYLRRPDHDTFCLNKKKTTKYINYENRIHGVLLYYKTSSYINKKMNMTPQKWDEYFTFCFIRNPYDKIISAWYHINRYNIPFKNYLNLINTCNDVEYMHMFLPQVRNIINEKGKININYIGKFENLENDLTYILNKIGIHTIIHDVNKIMNKRDHLEFYKYYNQESLDIVNILLKEDFQYLDYPKFNNINDFFKTFHHENSIENSVENNVENSFKNNVENSFENNVENSFENNAENSFENNVENSFENSFENNVENNVENSFENNVENSSENNIQNKICCLYVYYEKNNNYKFNFIYFLNNAILDDIDYYIIINGKNIEIPIYILQKDNVKVFYRPNNGYDFGAYSHAIKKIDKDYDYYFFINTSVLGPFITNKNKKWTDYFIELFNKNVKVVGTSINIYRKYNVQNYNLINMYGKKKVFSHIQSMFFCIDNEYFNYLQNIHFFHEEELNNKDFNYIIAYKEVGLSQIALNNNWNINCLLPKYKNLDYRRLNYDINITSRNGDPYYDKSYFGQNIKKEDVIFYKNNRL